MPFDKEDYQNFQKLPKVGEKPIVITIKNIERVDAKESQFNFSTRKDGNCGFHYRIELTNGKSFALGIWKLFFALRDAGVEEGDTVKISHPEHGVWQVQKKEDKPKVDPDLQRTIEKTTKTLEESWEEEE